MPRVSNFEDYLRFVSGRYCFIVHFYFALPVAFRAVTGVAGRLATILTFISRGLSNQDVDQRGMDRILTSFRSVTFRAYHRRHMNVSFRAQFGVGLMNTIAKMVDEVSDRIGRTCQNLLLNPAKLLILLDEDSVVQQLVSRQSRHLKCNRRGQHRAI